MTFAAKVPDLVLVDNSYVSAEDYAIKRKKCLYETFFAYQAQREKHLENITSFTTNLVTLYGTGETPTLREDIDKLEIMINDERKALIACLDNMLETQHEILVIEIDLCKKCYSLVNIIYNIDDELKKKTESCLKIVSDESMSTGETEKNE